MLKLDVDEPTYLLLLQREHTMELFNLIVENADHIGAWLPFARATKRVEDTSNFVESTLQDFATGIGINLGIWHGGILVGTVDLRIHKKDESASLGYWLGQAHVRKGIMTQSCKALIDYAFRELKLHRIEIRANTENRKSRAIPERLGFTQEGIAREAFKLYDRFNDSAIYGMLDREWLQVRVDDRGR